MFYPMLYSVSPFSSMLQILLYKVSKMRTSHGKMRAFFLNFPSFLLHLKHKTDGVNFSSKPDGFIDKTGR
jgi:hypothetical protein